jgi:hypothetical protein
MAGALGSGAGTGRGDAWVPPTAANNAAAAMSSSSFIE